jgi:WD40 repeat protein
MRLVQPLVALALLASVLNQAAYADTGPAVTGAPAPQAKAARTDQYGDPLPEGAVARLGTQRLRHAAPVHTVIFARDGKSLFAAGDAIREWDVATGRELRQLGKLRYVEGFTLSPSGRCIAFASGDGVRVHDLATGKELWQLPRGKVPGSRLSRLGHELVAHHLPIAYSPDGRLLATAGWGPGIGLLQADSHEAVGGSYRHRFYALALAFSPGGKRFASVGIEGTICLWDAAGCKEIRAWDATGRFSFVESIAFSPDEKMLLAGGSRGVRAWDVATGKERPALPALRDWRSGPVRFSPNGRLLAVGGSDGTIRLVDVTTGKRLRDLVGHEGRVLSLDFAPDGKTLASGGDDHTLRLWDAKAGKELHPFAGNEGVASHVAFSADGKTIAVAAEARVRFWKASADREMRRLSVPRALLPYGIIAFALPPNGRVLVASHGDEPRLFSWDASGHCEVRRWQGHRVIPNVEAMFSPDGKTMASCGGPEGAILVWDVSTGRLLRGFSSSDGSPDCMVFAPDGKSLFAACSDGTVRRWQTATGRELHAFQNQEPRMQRLAVTPDGRTLASWGEDHNLRLWETLTGAEVLHCKLPEEEVLCLAMSPDGRLAVAGTVAGELVVCDAIAGHRLTRRRGHRGAVRALAFAPDGRTLVSGSADTTALVWDCSAWPERALEGSPLRRARARALWDALKGDDAVAAYQARWALAAAPREALALLRSQMKPAWVTALGRIEGMIRDLDDGRFAVRERASRQLQDLGEVAEPALRRTLEKTGSAEVRRRATQLLERMEDRVSAEQRRSLRALAVLEHIGTGDARQLLKTLAEGQPGARLTREAKAALERLEKRKFIDGKP